MAVNKPDIKMGFYLAVGFFLFGLVLAVAQYMFMKVRKA